MSASWKSRLLGLLVLAAVTYAFLISLELMSTSFRMMGEGFANSLVSTASNPFIGLFVGMLATALIQRSSVTTSAVVILVASGAFGPVNDPTTLSMAVPVIMGANIGTTITSIIVSLGHITIRSEYRRAISTSTLHSLFNIFTVLIMFPLEMFFGVLSRPAAAMANWLTHIGPGNEGIFTWLKFMRLGIEPIPKLLVDLSADLFGINNIALPITLLVFALFVLFFSLYQLTLMVRKLVIGRFQERLEGTFFGHPLKAFGWGIGITALLQSSSATTSLTVPLVATGKIALRKAFPFIIGANIGTTATAMIAALLATGGQLFPGLAVAFCHVLFNLFGAIIIMPFAKIRNIPVRLALKLGTLTLNNRLVGISYLAITFFLIPFLLILLSNNLPSGKLSHADNNPANRKIEAPIEKY